MRLSLTGVDILPSLWCTQYKTSELLLFVSEWFGCCLTIFTNRLELFDMINPTHYPKNPCCYEDFEKSKRLMIFKYSLSSPLSKCPEKQSTVGLETESHDSSYDVSLLKTKTTGRYYTIHCGQNNARSWRTLKYGLSTWIVAVPVWDDQFACCSACFISSAHLTLSPLRKASIVKIFAQKGTIGEGSMLLASCGVCTRSWRVFSGGWIKTVIL